MLSETREGPNTPVGGPEKPGKYVTPHVAMKSSNYYQFSSATDTVRGIKSET